MAPITRGRTRANTAGGNIEPLSPALESNTLTPARPSHSHVRFDQDEEVTPTAAREAGAETDEIAKELNSGKVLHVNGTGSARDEILDSQEKEEKEDLDDDAPETMSMGTGKKEAKKREEDARRVVGAQKEADKKKRKERDTKLKEQKAEAEERKRKRESKRRRLETAEDEQDAAIEDQLNREVMAVTKEAESVPISANVTSEESKPSLLLPESLLAQIAARPSPPPPNEDEDENEDEEMDVNALVRTGNSARASARLEKNRRRREQKKKNKILKKGVVSVKVLKDEAASRKSMAPPASKKVTHIKESWLYRNRKGGIQRRSVSGGFIKQR